MISVVNIVASTLGGLLFFYVLYTYDQRDRFTNTLIAVLGAILDTYPVFFGGMTESVTLMGAIHGLITMSAYILFISWLVAYNRKLYVYFCFTWIFAYLSGYLAAAAAIT